MSLHYKTIATLVVLFLSMLLFTSCGAYVKNKSMEKMTVENKAIPSNFGQDNEILVCVLQGRNSRDRYMRKHVEENYFGKYVFLLSEEISEEVYTDLDTYRYVFDYNAGSVLGQNGRPLPTSSYYIYDRKENVYYYSDAYSGMFGKLILAYTLSLERVRQEHNN